MSLKSTILSAQPTSYWPLDDLDGSSCHDEMGLTMSAYPAAPRQSNAIAQFLLNPKNTIATAQQHAATKTINP
jgi:hypothetical protein